MRKICFLIIVTAAALFLGSLPGQARADADEQHGGIDFTRLAEGVWLHTSYMQVGDNPSFPVNGVVAVDQGQAVVIDLPIEVADADSLFEWIRAKGWLVKYVVPQHWHKDSTGGLPAAHRQGLTVVMLDKTQRLVAKEHPDWPAAAITFSDRVSLRYGDRVVELAHHGGGHTADSVVAWLPETQMLVGGCLIKSHAFKNLGYIGDADRENYLSTLQALKDVYYARAKIVTTGHGLTGTATLIDHNIVLCKKQFGE